MPGWPDRPDIGLSNIGSETNFQTGVRSRPFIGHRLACLVTGVLVILRFDPSGIVCLVGTKLGVGTGALWRLLK